LRILFVVLVLAVAVIIGQNQTKAFGEISTLTPPDDTIKVNGTSFTIPYISTGGTITLIQADTDAKTIDVSVQSQHGGNLTITLPTALINAYQGVSLEPEYLQGENNRAHFVVTNKNHGIHYAEVDTAENRTLTIPFSLGNSTIEIKGTYMIPEFGSLTSIILVISIISAIVISKNLSRS
jgi:predicted secreted protein with PEFG-CTERM motif